MAGRNNIGWTRADASRLSWAVRKFNAAVDAAIDADPEKAEVMPDMVDYQDIRSRIHTRQEFKNELNRLERIHREGSTDLVAIDKDKKFEVTKYELKEAQLLHRRKNAYLRKKRGELEQLEAMQGEKELGYKVPQMGSEAKNAYQPRKFTTKSINNKNAWKMFMANLEKMTSSKYDAERIAVMKDNYCMAIRNTFGNTTESNKLIAKIQSMRDYDFWRKYYQQADAKFGYIYSKDDIDKKFDVINDIFKPGDNENFDLVTDWEERMTERYNESIDE